MSSDPAVSKVWMAGRCRRRQRVVRCRLAVCVLAAFASGCDDPRLTQSREIAAEFQQDLGGRLMSALSSGGPVEAISVCKIAAPQISGDLSNNTGALVARTALKVRNPDNKPDAAARAVLEEFAADIDAGATEPPEQFERRADGSARYMKAIIMQPMCLACHGKELAPAVQAAITESYPQDEATGFAAGDLRGAFIIEWPSDGHAP